MRETLKMMREVISGYEKQMSVDDLVREYKEKQSPNILAFLYANNFGIILQVANQYKMLNEQDKASFILMELDNALKKYDTTRQCGFITFFVVCLKNRLRAEQEALLAHLRYANYVVEDLAEYQEIEDKDFEYNLFSLEGFNLSRKEKLQCELIMDGYSNKEIADMMGVSKMAITYRNRAIGKKLEGLI